MLNRLGQAAGLAGIALFAMSTPATAAETDELEDALAVERLLVLESEEHGEHLATVDGRSVYMFDADSEGESACYDDCATAWPPLTPMDGVPEAGDGVNEDMIDTIERDDGIEQVTYDGQPLYAFVRDTEAKETRGHGVEGFGGEWSLVSPDGGMAGAEKDDSDAVGSDPEAGEPDASEKAREEAEETDGTEGADGVEENDAVGSEAESGEPAASENAREMDGTDGEDGVEQNDAVGSDAEAGEPEAAEEATDGES